MGDLCSLHDNTMPFYRTQASEGPEINPLQTLKDDYIYSKLNKNSLLIIWTLGNDLKLFSTFQPQSYFFLWSTGVFEQYNQSLKKRNKFMKGREFHENFSISILKLEKWKWKSLSSVWLFVTLWTDEFMEFSKPEWWIMGGLSLLQGIFPTQESNPSLPHCRPILYQLSHKGSQEYWSG